MEISKKDLQEIFRKVKKQGVLISLIVKEYGYSYNCVYYNIRKKEKDRQKERDKEEWEKWKVKKEIIKPRCYKDYLQNNVIKIEQRLREKKGEITTDELVFLKSELHRLKYWVKIDRHSFPCSADILQ
jgi:hypothetical protein